MAHPIAGENQYPFLIGGLLVDSAKIDGVVYSKELYIYKQSSSFMFDLIHATTGRIFKDVIVTWYNDKALRLNYNDTSLYIAKQLPERTFAKKVQDPSRGIYGFMVMYHLNKIKVSTGDYIFIPRDAYGDLVGVTIVPQTLVIEKGKTDMMSVAFFPSDYQNTFGNWNSLDNSIACPVIPTSTMPYAIIDALDVGQTAISFTPLDNPLQTAMGYVYVVEPEPRPDSFNKFYPIVRPNYENMPPIPRSQSTSVWQGDEITVTLIFDPYNYVPKSEPIVTYTQESFEYLGTDDYINYKFKVKVRDDLNDTQMSTASISFVVDNDGIEVQESLPYLYVQARKTTNYPMLMNYIRTGTIAHADLNVNEYRGTWYSNDETILKSLGNGSYEALKEGSTSIYYINPFGYKSDVVNIFVGDNYADYVIIEPTYKKVLAIGDEIQLSRKVVPAQYESTYELDWNIANLGLNNLSGVTISDTGLVTITPQFKNPIWLAVNIRTSTQFNSNPNGNRAMPHAPIWVNETLPEIKKLLSFPEVAFVQAGYQTKSRVKISRPITGKEYLVTMTDVQTNGAFTYETDEVTAATFSYYVDQCLVITGVKKGHGTITYMIDNDPSTAFTLNVYVY